MKCYVNKDTLCPSDLFPLIGLSKRKTYTWSSRKSSHSWNPADFTWNLADFKKSGRLQVKSTQDLIKSDVSTKSLQFVGCMEGDMTPDFMKSKVTAPLLHSSNWIVFVWNIWFYKVLGGFHLKSAGFHLKSGGFHVKSKDHLQGIVTLCLCSFCTWTSIRATLWWEQLHLAGVGTKWVTIKIQVYDSVCYHVFHKVPDMVNAKTWAKKW